LQGVRARRQLQHDFGLTVCQVNVVLIKRQRIAQLISPVLAFAKRRAIDQEYMMPGSVLLGASGRKRHALQREDDLNW